MMMIDAPDHTICHIYYINRGDPNAIRTINQTRGPYRNHIHNWISLRGREKRRGKEDKKRRKKGCTYEQ